MVLVLVQILLMPVLVLVLVPLLVLVLGLLQCQVVVVPPRQVLLNNCLHLCRLQSLRLLLQMGLLLSVVVLSTVWEPCQTRAVSPLPTMDLLQERLHNH